MKSLVCCRDIAHAERYFQFASSVLDALNSEVVLLCVGERMDSSIEKVFEEMIQIFPKPPVERKVADFNFLDSLIAESKRNPYDLIVINSQDQPTIEELLLGTVADRVIKAAKTSVLIVDHPSADIKNVLVSTGGHEMSDQTVNTGIAIAEKIKAKVTLLHVVASVPSMYAGLDRLDESLEEVLHTNTPLARHLKAKAADMKVKGIDARIELRHGLPSEEIVRASYIDKADLLIVGYSEDTRFYRIFRDHLSLDVVDRAGCPVLVVNRRTPWHSAL